MSLSMRFDLSPGLVPALVDEIHRAALKLMEGSGVPLPERAAGAVVIEELSTNIIEHSGANWLEMEIGSGDGSAQILMRDNGAPFDPVALLRSRGIDRDLSRFTDRRLGLHMVQEFTDSFRYERSEVGHNLVSLEIRKAEK